MEVRQLDDGSLHITGYVNITDKSSRVLKDNKGNLFVERVEPRCFKRALKKNNVDFLLNHDTSKKLGSIADGNLKLTEDNIGLKIEATVNNEEVRQAYENGGFSGFSYGFQKIRDNFRDWDNGIQLRTLQDIKLIEVSLLDNTKIPAYFGSLVNVEHREEGATDTEIRAFSNKLEEETELKEVEQRADELVKPDLSALFDIENFIKTRR